MSEIPNNLKYSKDHEWVNIEDNIATIGITLHAAESLGDIVYVDVSSLNQELKQFITSTNNQCVIYLYTND